MVDPGAALEDDGFVVLPKILSQDQLAAAMRHADQLLRGVGWSDNDFDGRRTRRVYGLLRDVGAFEALLTHPQVRTLVAARLGEVHQFGMLASDYLGFVAGRDPQQWLLDRNR